TRADPSSQRLGVGERKPARTGPERSSPGQGMLACGHLTADMGIMSVPIRGDGRSGSAGVQTLSVGGRSRAAWDAPQGAWFVRTGPAPLCRKAGTREPRRRASCYGVSYEGGGRKAPALFRGSPALLLWRRRRVDARPNPRPIGPGAAVQSEG